MFGRATIRLGIGPHSSSISSATESPCCVVALFSFQNGTRKSTGKEQNFHSMMAFDD